MSRVKWNFCNIIVQIKYKIIGLYRELNDEEKIIASLSTREGRRLFAETMAKPISKAIFYVGR